MDEELIINEIIKILKHHYVTEMVISAGEEMEINIKLKGKNPFEHSHDASGHYIIKK